MGNCFLENTNISCSSSFQPRPVQKRLWELDMSHTPTWPAHGTAAAPQGVHECAGATSRRAFAWRRGFAAIAAAAQKE